MIWRLGVLRRGDIGKERKTADRQRWTERKRQYSRKVDRRRDIQTDRPKDIHTASQTDRQADNLKQ